jgi:membrane protease subunit HflC
MSRAPLLVWLILAFVAGLVAFNSVYVVDQRREAIVLQLGQPVEVVHAGRDGPGLELAPGAGLHFKVPFMQRVIEFDRRNQALEVDQEEVTTSDQQKLVVDAFLRYRISEPLQYYRTLRDDTTAHDQLQRLLNSSLRQVLGDTSQQDTISGRRDELMQLSRQDVARRAKANGFGVEIIDLRIKRADLPSANQASVYRRMQTSRQQIAFQFRADGEQQKRQIMAAADKDVTITLATARQTGETTRGEGDAIRTRLFAQSYGKDPAFAKVYRSLQAYEKALGQGDTTIIMSPEDYSFFDVFAHGPGGGGRAAAPKR